MSDTTIEWADKATWHEKTAAKRIGVAEDEYLRRKQSGEKWCTRCKGWHSIDRFGFDKSRGDGRDVHCLSVKKIITAEERRSRINQAYRNYYAIKGGANIRSRVYARKRNMDPVTPRTRELVFDQFHGLCVYCGEKADTIDHVIPVKHGGDSQRGNLLPACSRCNSSKKIKSLDEFLADCYRKGFHVHDAIAEELCMSEVL